MLILDPVARAKRNLELARAARGLRWSALAHALGLAGLVTIPRLAGSTDAMLALVALALPAAALGYFGALLYIVRIQVNLTGMFPLLLRYLAYLPGSVLLSAYCYGRDAAETLRAADVALDAFGPTRQAIQELEALSAPERSSRVFR